MPTRLIGVGEAVKWSFFRDLAASPFTAGCDDSTDLAQVLSRLRRAEWRGILASRDLQELVAQDSSSRQQARSCQGVYFRGMNDEG
jgi:hypothetical protein